MPTKPIPAEQRKTAPVIAMVPSGLREQVEQIARREQVSISEVGRRALSEYVEKQSKSPR
jgi:hypothetical protein